MLTLSEKISDAIDALLDDTGPVAALPANLRRQIQGDIDSAVRTLTQALDRAEEIEE